MRSSLWGIVLETLLFALCFFLLGIFFNRQDPLFLSSNFNYALLLSVVITLFYGLIAGLSLLVIFVIEGYFFYEHFPYVFYLQNFLFILVCGEFYFYWKDKLKGSEEKLRYFRRRLRELGRSFYILKISHQQLEEKYITKPYSLRNILYDIENSFTKSKQDALFKLNSLLINFFKLKNFELLLVDSKQKKFFSFEGIEKEISSAEKTFIEQALELKECVLVPAQEPKIKDLLAVIPGFNWDNEAFLVLLVREMDFLDLNEENILSIFITLCYLATRIGFKNQIQPDGICELCEPRFVQEVKTLTYLGNKFNLKSSLIIIKLDNNLKNYFSSSNFRLRMLDRIEFVEFNSKKFALILFPFEGEYGVWGFIERLKDENLELKDYKIFSLHKLTFLEVKSKLKKYLSSF